MSYDEYLLMSLQENPSDEMPMSMWLSHFGIYPNNQKALSRCPTPDEVYHILDNRTDCTVRYETTENGWTAFITWHIKQEPGEMYTSSFVEKHQSPSDYRFGNCPEAFVIDISKQLTHICGQLVLFRDEGNYIPALINQKSTTMDIQKAWERAANQI